MGLFKRLFGSRSKEAAKAPEPRPASQPEKITTLDSRLAESPVPVHEALRKDAPPWIKNNRDQAPTITITFKPVESAPVGALTHLDFGKTDGVLGCFLNYEPRVLREPSDRQLAYLKDLGVFIPDGITNRDATCMISRATGEDSLEGPAPELVALAVGLGVEFSAFIGSDGLLRAIVGQASEKDRAALFAYGVRQSLRGASFGNMLEDPEVGVLYSFADRVVADPALLRSLNGRAAEDYLSPHRGTAIYKAATAMIAGGGA